MSAIILSNTNLAIQDIVTLYPDTSEEGAVAILITEIVMISKSEASDALHYDGVYFIDMNLADQTMPQVAYNNYCCSYAKKP